MDTSIFSGAVPIPPSRLVERSAIEARKRSIIAELTRRQELFLAYLGDSISSITEGYFADETFNEVPPANQNLLDRAIRKMSLVYKNQPEHDYGDAKVPENYYEIKRWVSMKNAERKVNLMGTSLLHPTIRGMDKDKRLAWDLIWYYFPIFDDSDLTKPSAVFYPLNVPFHDVSRDNKIPWVYWSATENYLFNEQGIITPKGEDEDTINPWGVFPFVQVSTREADDAFSQGYGGPLLDANTAINIGLTEMRLGVRFDLMGQWVAKNLGPDAVMEIGVNKLVKISGEGAELEIISPEADIEKAIKYAKFEYENALQNVGMWVQWGESADQPSGQSLTVKNLELIERREDDATIWLQADKEQYTIEQVIWEKESLGGKLPERGLNFSEIEIRLGAADQILQDEFDLKHNLTTPAKLLLRDNPDLGEVDDAQKIIDENKQNNLTGVSGRSMFRG